MPGGALKAIRTAGDAAVGRARSRGEQSAGASIPAARTTAPAAMVPVDVSTPTTA
jgi:hypothetical protein